MFTDTINRQTFEFTCKAEETAKKIQHTIESHTATQINHIISSILSTAAQSDNYLKIDKIEIDLGDITTHDFGSDQMLASFKEILVKQLNKIRPFSKDTNELFQNNNDRFNTAIEGAVVTSQLQNDLEMIESFILLGNVPWWVDKNSGPDIDSVIQKMIRQYPQAFRQLLEEHRANADVILRLFTQMRPATISKIAEIMPELSGTDPKQRFIYESIEQGIYTLSPLHIKKLKTILNRHPQASIDRLRQLLVQRLMLLFVQIQQNNLPAGETGLGRLLLKLGVQELFSLISSSKSHGRTKRRNKREIVTLVNNLNVFEAELLLFELTRFSNKYQFSHAELGAENYFESGDQTTLNVSEEVGIARKDAVETEDAFFDTITNKPGEIPTGNTSETLLPGWPDHTANKENDQVSEDLYSRENAQNAGPAPENMEQNVEPSAIPGKKGDPVEMPGKRREWDDPESENEKQQSAGFEEGNDVQGIFTPTDAIKGDQQRDTVQMNRETGEEKQPAGFAAPAEPGEIQTKAEEAGFYRMIAFIMKRLNTSDPVIFHYLEQLGNKNLEQLAAIFKQHILDNIEHKKTVRSLVEHPALFTNNILKVFAGLVPGKGMNPQGLFGDPVEKTQRKNTLSQVLLTKIQTSQAAFLYYLEHLPVKNLFIIKDILQKGRFDTNNEKDLIKRMLFKLPQENILFLKFLAELPEHEMEQLLSSEHRKLPPAPATGAQEAKRFYSDELQNHILIENAGLCLLAVYLPGFFRQLGYLENGMFRNKAFAIRAIYVLQYITTGQTRNPEYLLQFNKLLCGLRIDDYITKSTRLSKKEISETGNLLDSIIRNWKVLKNTSSDGLRESLLKRKGNLTESESKWTLQVEKKGYDVLLNTIPWGYSMIKLPWMKKFIQVEW